MLRRWRTELIALAVAIAVGVGLGLVLTGRDSEQDRAKQAAATYLHAFADDDPAALCDIVSPLGRVQLEYGSSSCEDNARATIRRLPEAERTALHEAQITVTSLNGNRASVRFSPKLSGREEMQLIKVGDEWLVNG